MKWSFAFEIGMSFMALLSIISLLSPSMMSTSTISNASTPFTPSGWTQIALGIAPYVTLIVSGLALLGRLLRDRNWRKKYKDVIVTEGYP